MEGLNGEVRVPFGQGETDTLPLPWAAAMLTAWRARDPAGFGALLAEVVTGTRPKMARQMAGQ